MLSAVVVVSGNDDDRKRNFGQFLSCVEHQSCDDYELVIVEQCVNGQFYKQIRPRGVLFRYCALEGSPFNLPWCRNVGAHLASGDILLLLEMDIVFGAGYFSEIVKSFDGLYSLGWSYFAWLNQTGTHRYCENPVYHRRWPEELVERQRLAMGGDAAQGGAVIFNRRWFFDVFGGFCEDFVGWGAEECEAMNRAAVLAGAWNTFPYTLAHLQHGNRLPYGAPNRKILELSRTVPKAFAEALVRAEVGKLGGPTRIIEGGTLIG